MVGQTALLLDSKDYVDLSTSSGPIVRTSPWELSIRDSEFYSQLYVAASTRRTDMWPRGREGNGFESK